MCLFVNSVAPHPRRARKVDRQVDHKAQTADGWFGARGDTVPQCLWCCVAVSESLGYDYCGVASRLPESFRDDVTVVLRRGFLKV